MMPYKHEIGDVVNLAFEITSNNVGVTGQTPVVAVQRISDSQWLNSAKTGWQAGYNSIAMTELDATNLPGVYGTDVTQFGGAAEKWRVFYKNTGTYAGIDVEAHEFTVAVWAGASRTLTAGTNIVLAKGTGVTGFNDLSAAQVNTECDTALTDYDPPTRIEATADKDAIIVQVDANEAKIDILTTESQSHPTLSEIEATTVLAKQVTLNTVAGYIDTEITSIINAIAALQTDLGDPSVDTTTLYAQLLLVKSYIDTEIAAIKTKTDQFTFTVANQVDSNALSGGGLDASRMTYHKHGMGEAITLSFPVISKGVGVAGQTPVVAVRKKSTGEWLNDAKTGWQAGYNDIAMAPIDATNLPGAYTLNITHIDLTSEEYQVYYKNTGTYAGIDFESHIFTGAVYVPPSSSYATGTVRGLLNIAMNKDANNTFNQATDSLEAIKDAGVGVDLTPVTNAIAALQTDLGDPSVDATTIYAKIQALQTAVAAISTGGVNVMSATKGAIQVSYAKSGGTIEIVKGDTISIPYGPLAKDITGRRVYFGVKQLLSDTAYSIAVKEITSSVTSFSTFTGTLPLTSAETGLAAGDYYAEIESKAADGLTLPATELKFVLRVVDQVIV